MAYLSTSKVEDNEVVKASDINFGFESQIDNVGKALQMALENSHDFVIGGKVTPYSGMNVQIAPIFGVCYSTSDYFGDTETFSPVAVTPASTQDRIDIVEIESTEETYDNEQRAFNDLETDIKTYKYTDTKKRRILNVVVKMGTPGAAVAPETTEGRVKIAEIHVGANVTEITEDDIYNITADIADMENEDWTIEKTNTYNIGYISDVNAKFRQEHNADGSHASKIIGTNELDSGTGDGQVNATSLPITKNVAISDSTVSVGSSIQTMIDTIATKVTNLFNSYLVNGAFNFNGELAVSSLVSSNVLTKAIKIGAAGNGTAYMKVGTSTVLTITSDGKLQTNGYTATATNDIVTKAVTDAINTTISALDTRVSTIEQTLVDNNTYTNGVLSVDRFEVDTTTIRVATTANITLSGTQTIDGVSLSAGDYVLVKNQTDATQNGIYQCASSSTWSRVTAYNTPAKLVGKIWTISEGTTNAGKMFYTPLVDFTSSSAFGSDEISLIEHIASVAKIGSRIVMRDSSGNIKVGSVNGYTFAAACEKGVDTTISASSTSTNLPTSKAVEDRINAHKGIDTEGTVTSITLTAGTGISLDVDKTAITGSGTRTITNSGVRSIASGTTNGTISVNTNGTSAEISVKGLASAAYKDYGTAAGNVPTIGTALGNTDKNIVVTDTNGKLKPSGASIGTAAGNVPTIGTALGNTDKNIVVTDTNGNLKPSGAVIGTAAGNVPTIGTALGTTANNIVCTNASGALIPSGTVIGSAAGKGVDTTASQTSTNLPTTGMAISCGNAGAICSTAMATQAKTVSLSGFTLYDGATVKVMFTNGNSASAPTLNVNGQGAHTIVVTKNDKFYYPVNHTGYWGVSSPTSSSTSSTRMWDKLITLELMYVGGTQTVYNASDSTTTVTGVWVIMGNPTVNSFYSSTSGYEVKADGLIKQYFYYNGGQSATGHYKDPYWIIPISITQVMAVTVSGFDKNSTTTSSARTMIGFDDITAPTVMRVYTHDFGHWGNCAILVGY